MDYYISTTLSHQPYYKQHPFYPCAYRRMPVCVHSTNKHTNTLVYRKVYKACLIRDATE